MNLLELDNLNFSYPSADASAYHFDMQLEAGKILAIVGKSGAGKSTFLDLVAGFLAPASGSIKIDGHDITHEPPSNRQVSILFQKNNLFEHLSVLSNACFGLNPISAPTSAQKEKASHMLESVGLKGYENLIAASLSGGEIQRVALAREMLRDTRIILLDEPFNGLDDATRISILPLFRQAVEGANRSIIMVTHDLPDIEGIIDQAAKIEDRKLTAI